MYHVTVRRRIVSTRESIFVGLFTECAAAAAARRGAYYGTHAHITIAVTRSFAAGADFNGR